MPFYRRYSSVVERALRKRTVVGSIPTGGSSFFLHQVNILAHAHMFLLKSGIAGRPSKLLLSVWPGGAAMPMTRVCVCEKVQHC